MAPVFVFDFNHPKIWIKAALTAKSGVSFRLRAGLQNDPGFFTAGEVKAALKHQSLAIQRVELDQDSPRRIVAMRHNERGNVQQTQSCEIGLHPEVGSEAAHGRIGAAFWTLAIVGASGGDTFSKRKMCGTASGAIFEIETHLVIALGFVQPVGAYFDLKKKMDLAAQKLGQFFARSF